MTLESSPLLSFALGALAGAASWALCRYAFLKLVRRAPHSDELTTLMSSISDAILAVDLDGVPLFYNARFVPLFAGGESLLKRCQIEQIFRVPEVIDAYRKTLAAGVGHQARLELRPVNENALRHFTLSVAPLKRGEGTVYGAVGIFHDVTESVRAERMRIEFVANVSHELRTPLTAIKGFTDTLEIDLKEGRMDSAQACLKVVTRNVGRLMALIQDLLNLSSLESEEFHDSQGMQLSRLDTAALTGRVLEPFQARLQAKEQQIEVRAEAPVVVGDPDRLEQVLTNLLENASKYVPVQGKIRIVWESSEKGVLLRVADNGPGIPLEHQARLFERFYRVDKARSRDQGGTGLGLAIVKHIMQRHGGSVWVRSEAGLGAEFVCLFPHQAEDHSAGRLLP